MTVREDRDNWQRGGRKDIGDLASGKRSAERRRRRLGFLRKGRKKCTQSGLGPRRGEKGGEMKRKGLWVCEKEQ